MHISAGKLDGADLRPKELWTMNEFKIFQDDQFCPIEVSGLVQLLNSD